eukprot:6198054-Pleurochrysis_carterae.AAC.2
MQMRANLHPRTRNSLPGAGGRATGGFEQRQRQVYTSQTRLAHPTKHLHTSLKLSRPLSMVPTA